VSAVHHGLETTPSVADVEITEGTKQRGPPLSPSSSSSSPPLEPASVRLTTTDTARSHAALAGVVALPLASAWRPPPSVVPDAAAEDDER
jgi:hypothetical protein